MEQTYHRRILVRREPARLAVDLEDNFHRFGVRLLLDGHTVAAVDGTARRVPWSTCPAAVAALQDLNGHDVRVPFAIDPGSKAARHCTHLFDIARLGLDHLRLGLPSRDYLIAVEGPIERERVRLTVDGRPVRSWDLSNQRFASPPEWRGRELGRMPAPVHADEDPPGFLEYMLMRRAVHIARGRFIDQDRWISAADVGASPSCISFQPQVRASARRVRGSARDFTGEHERLLADLGVGARGSGSGT